VANNNQPGQQAQEVVPYRLSAFRLHGGKRPDVSLSREGGADEPQPGSGEALFEATRAGPRASTARRIGAEASPAVATPPDSRMLAGDVVPQRGLNEAKAKVLVIKWEGPKAVEGAARIRSYSAGRSSLSRPDTPNSRSRRPGKTVPARSASKETAAGGNHRWRAGHRAQRAADQDTGR